MKPIEFKGNVFDLVGNDWMLIGATDGTRSNMMTASWGGMGVLWSEDVCFVFVRPSRYTYDIIENTRYITLSFFDKKYRSALSFCGTKSGRDVDKSKESGLTMRSDDGFVTFDEAKITVRAEKIFCSDFTPDNFIDKSIIPAHYKSGDFHRMYVCRILDISQV